MAKHCTNCGHELQEGGKFCAECGTPVDGMPTQAQPAPQGHWERRTFTVNLGEARFSGRIAYPLDGGIPSTKSGDIGGYIEKEVNSLVARVASEGWEPDESINANTLWKEKHVKWDAKGGTFTNLHIVVTSVSVRFRRWVTL